jgi:glycosyltransferase involved in cell wall biosynthesis
MSDVILVIPCYNEAARLDAAAIRGFVEVSPRVELLFVDDGSTDATLDVLQSLARDAPRCSVLRQPKNGGKAEAVRAGVLAALERTPRYVGYWDADLATPLPALRDFLRVLDARPELLLALGSRVQLLGRAIERDRARHYIGRIFATAVSLVLGLRVYDTQCGAKLFRVDDSLPPLFRAAFNTRWVFDVEVLARMIAARGGDRAATAAVMYEMPLLEWRDVSGSKVRWVDGIRAFADVVRIWGRYLAPGRRATARETLHAA